MKSNNNNRNPMTNEELIATFRAEIEKRITHNTFGAKLELIDILAWLDTLESEKLVPNDLEEASSKFATHTVSNGVSVEFLEEKLSFQEGAKWAREQMMKDGLDAVKSGQSDKIEKTIAGVFVKYGMDKQKELMMKSAKDGWIDEEDVIILNDGTSIDLQPDYEKKPAFEFEYAQDVRVIILPKGD